nr:MAG TPA: hypothetical protein [Caudoviricetes sp.]
MIGQSATKTLIKSKAHRPSERSRKKFRSASHHLVKIWSG